MSLPGGTNATDGLVLTGFQVATAQYVAENLPAGAPPPTGVAFMFKKDGEVFPDRDLLSEVIGCLLDAGEALWPGPGALGRRLEAARHEVPPDLRVHVRPQPPQRGAGLRPRRRRR